MPRAEAPTNEWVVEYKDYVKGVPVLANVIVQAEDEEEAVRHAIELGAGPGPFWPVELPKPLNVRMVIE